MIIKSAVYKTSVVNVKKILDDGVPEFAFVGRSNVGKSSLINNLVNSKGLAKASSTPGKTKMINYFDINNNDSLKGLNNDAKLDIISCTNSFLTKTAVADKTEFINIKDNLVGEIIHSDSTFFCDLCEKDSHLICESLSKSFDKVEKYLGVSLELQEKNSILKRLFFK